MNALGRRVKAFGAFVYDFVIGDDWRIALGVTLALAATWELHRRGVAAWWLLPAVVAVVLASSLVSVTRAGTTGASTPAADGDGSRD